MLNDCTQGLYVLAKGSSKWVKYGAIGSTFDHVITKRNGDPDECNFWSRWLP